ncbi:hypothetical protein GGI17_002426 [Coemansia sp. S146]|nr:hypothetical protein GGI17_002426 [Coemansia sp. S146]
MLDVYRGAALKVLSSESYINCTFPKVRSIKFKFLDPSALEQQVYNAIASPTIESNISAFVQRIKLIAPLANKITISVSPLNSYKPLFLLSRLATLLRSPANSQWILTTNFRDSHGLRNPVYENFDSADSSEQIMQLARRNASTLQFLKIDVYAIVDITGLIQNDDGSYVQYPYLHTFKISGKPGSDVPRQLVFPGAVPFPSLRQLDIGYLTPFGDETVFRGNTATLESLILMPNPLIVTIIREYKIFTPVSHSKLQYVNLGAMFDPELSLFNTDVDYMRFVLSIGPNAPVRDISYPLTNLVLQYMLPVFGEYTCIQVLTLETLHLDLWDVIALAKTLPLLSDLHTPYPAVGTLPYGVAEPELLEYIIANYAPAGKRLR